MIKLEFSANTKEKYAKGLLKVEHNKTNSLEILMLVDQLLDLIEKNEKNVDRELMYKTIEELHKSNKKKKPLGLGGNKK